MTSVAHRRATALRACDPIFHLIYLLSNLEMYLEIKEILLVLKKIILILDYFVLQFDNFISPFQSQPSPSEVVQWSNHRVMEWLRAVDLAEYAPNLRGSGVHGGLIVRFSVTSHVLLAIGSCIVFLTPKLCSSTDPGTSLHLRDVGSAAKYPSTEDAAPPPPRHCLLCTGGGAGRAGEARVRQRHRPRASHHHGQSKGNSTDCE